MNDKCLNIVVRKGDKYWNGTAYVSSKEEAMIFDESNKWDLLNLPIIEGVESEVVE